MKIIQDEACASSKLEHLAQNGTRKIEATSCSFHVLLRHIRAGGWLAWPPDFDVRSFNGHIDFELQKLHNSST